MYWLVLAALGDALTAILGCAGLLAGVWFMARGSRAPVGLSIVSSAAPPAPAPAPAPGAEPPDPPATTFRHGAIRLVGEPAPAPAPALTAVPPEPEPEPAPTPELAAVPPEPAPEPEPPVPAYLPPPVPQAPRTSFRQGPIRLGGIEHGIRGPGDEPPDAA